MYEINIRIKHTCPYSAIANLFDFPIYEFCSDLYDLLIFPKVLDESEIGGIKENLAERESVEIYCPKPLDTTYVYFHCMCTFETGVVPHIKTHGGIIEYPIKYENEWEYYNIICLNKKTQSSVLEYIQTIPIYEIISIKDLGREGLFKTQFLSMHQMFKSMTVRQVEVLIKAYERGYYEIPRTVKTNDLATEFEVSRTATEKSLRKAENAIIGSVIPYLLVHQRVHKQSED